MSRSTHDLSGLELRNLSRLLQGILTDLEIASGGKHVTKGRIAIDTKMYDLLETVIHKLEKQEQQLYEGNKSLFKDK